MKRIAQLMTPQPWTVNVDDSLSVARRMLAEREVHHLPVVDAGQVIGMVTDRDLALVGNRLATVADAMVSVVRVASDASLEDVLDTMTRRRVDAVVITSDDAVKGIFTSTDAVHVLLATLRRRRARA